MFMSELIIVVNKCKLYACIPTWFTYLKGIS